MDRFQFYPTFRTLAARAWAKFQPPHDYIRILEPSAGNGDLACAMPHYELRRGRGSTLAIDCCEIDITRHARLREQGFTVVATDFLKMRNGAMYSHCIMNPPFNEGAKHVLHAWDILWSAEIVAILNAETLRNPYTKERQRLLKLIEQHGSVEYVGQAFMDDDAERKADVEVAIVYLRKVANVVGDVIGDLIRTLKTDERGEGDFVHDDTEFQQLALLAASIENMVLTFNAAVTSMREAVAAEVRADYYASLLGQPLEMKQACETGAAPSKFDGSIATLQRRMHGAYHDLKNRAWTSFIHSSNVKSRLSAKVLTRVEKEFDSIKQLDFTLPNIYGFVLGLIESQGEIQMNMACDLFDAIGQYHTDNLIFYKGWKSNNKHRLCGMRVRAKRFVIPDRYTDPSYNKPSGETLTFLGDFDKVFAMLDGKVEPEMSLADAFRDNFDVLKAGQRISSSYFDIRYYPGARTIHYFPRNAVLMDRLNRMVGRHREWLPPESARVSEGFWLQYENAESFDKALRAAVVAKDNLGRGARDSLSYITSNDEHNSTKAQETVHGVLADILQEQGIDTDFKIEQAQQSLLLA